MPITCEHKGLYFMQLCFPHTTVFAHVDVTMIYPEIISESFGNKMQQFRNMNQHIHLSLCDTGLCPRYDSHPSRSYPC
jgi:hypothetical protein